MPVHSFLTGFRDIPRGNARMKIEWGCWSFSRSQEIGISIFHYYRSGRFGRKTKEEGFSSRLEEMMAVSIIELRTLALRSAFFCLRGWNFRMSYVTVFRKPGSSLKAATRYTVGLPQEVTCGRSNVGKVDTLHSHYGNEFFIGTDTTLLNRNWNCTGTSGLATLRIPLKIGFSFRFIVIYDIKTMWTG